MSEVINNSRIRIDNLKDLIRDIHGGKSIEESKKKLSQLMGSIPHGEVVAAEQELINEGFPEEEIIKYCDLHSEALKGTLNEEVRINVPDGHPVHTFKMENGLINRRIESYQKIRSSVKECKHETNATHELYEVKKILNDFADLDKHYLRKENLLFPFLERNKITGPPTVMWAKDDEVRSFIKSSMEGLKDLNEINAGDLQLLIETILDTLVKLVAEMIYKEENILFPMAFDTLTENDWFEIYLQSDEIGYCLYDPKQAWSPELIDKSKYEEKSVIDEKIRLSTGSFSVKEIDALFKTLPADITFVDKDDRVKFFSEGKERIFARNRAILGRLVQNCHPPSSVHIVAKILDDFKNKKQDEASFWINFGGKFVHIAYYAVRDEDGNYLGTLEVTQNIGQYKELQGERRILQYDS